MGWRWPPARSRTCAAGWARRNRAHRASLRHRALAIPVACMDETGLRLAEGTTWLHVLCDDDVTWYPLGGRGRDLDGLCRHRGARPLRGYWTR